jgi:hypothetical protein
MIERKKIGTVTFWVLLGLYLVDVALPIVGKTWLARSGVHLFWSGFLFFVLPMMTSLVGMVFVYGKQKFSWWLAPILVYIVAPAALVATVLLRSGTLVHVQEAAQNTQGFAAGAFIAAVVVSSAIAFPLFIGSPIVLAVCIWAEKDIKKVVAIPVISFVVLTVTFFLLLIDRA